MESNYDKKIKATSAIIILIGTIACLISFLINKEFSIPLINFSGEDMKTTFVSVGCSLIASGIATITTFSLISDRNTSYEVVDKWGLINIYEKRSEMNIDCDLHMKDLRYELDMISFGLRNFRDAVGDDIKERVKNGLKVRILTLKPKSFFVLQREKDEDCLEGEITKTLLDLVAWVEELKKVAPNQDNVKIRFYDTIPLFSYQRIDNYIYLGPYLYGLTSQKTISYGYKSGSRGYNYYKGYFEKVWGNSKFCTDSYQ